MIYPTGVRKGMEDNGTAVYIKSVRIALGIAYDMEWLLLWGSIQKDYSGMNIDEKSSPAGE